MTLPLSRNVAARAAVAKTLTQFCIRTDYGGLSQMYLHASVCHEPREPSPPLTPAITSLASRSLL